MWTDIWAFHQLVACFCFPSCKSEPCDFFFPPLILFLAKSTDKRDKLSPTGSEKVIANPAFQVRWQVFLPMWAYQIQYLFQCVWMRMCVVRVWVCVCVSQHFWDEMSAFTFLQGYDRRKSCSRLEHPVLDVNTVMQPGFSSLCWKNNLPYHFISASPASNNNDGTSL